MKQYKTIDQLIAEAKAIHSAFDTLTDYMGYDVLSDTGEIQYDAYEYILEAISKAASVAEALANIHRSYCGLVNHYEALSDYEKRHTWNNPRVHKVIKRYAKRNFTPELRTKYAEFAA